MASDGRAARYVAIITDGNGRWAQQRGLPVIDGHQAGADVVKARLRDAVEFGRARADRLLVLDRELVAPGRGGHGAHAHVLPAHRSPRRPSSTTRACACASSAAASASPAALLEQMDWAEAETAANDRITLYVAFNYGGRAEILDAAERYSGGGEEAFRRLLYAPEMHDPDLIIRTSGEQRMSNYLLWQSAYSELVFADELWPDFSREAFRAALDEFERRAAPVRGR